MTALQAELNGEHKSFVKPETAVCFSQSIFPETAMHLSSEVSLAVPLLYHKQPLDEASKVQAALVVYELQGLAN